jgi:hypothetical protein
MNIKKKNKDERETFIENVSYKFGYNMIAFVLLLDVIVRALIYKEAAWDLLGIIGISGFVMTLYQYKQKILNKKWVKTVAISSAIAFVFSFLIAVIINIF